MKDPFAEALTGLLNRSGKNHYDMYKYHGKSVCFVDLHPHRGHEVKRCMMNFKQNEEAVSPVIGVILMVAITVILAAVIAAFVFGMTGNVQTTKTVGLNLQKDVTSLQITILGGPDLPTLSYLKVTIDGKESVYTKSASKTLTTGTTSLSAAGAFSVGDVFKTENNLLSTTGYKHIVVVGHFSDGQDQMLADKQL